jgi:hypothetical protein
MYDYRKSNDTRTKLKLVNWENTEILQDEVG